MNYKSKGESKYIIRHFRKCEYKDFIDRGYEVKRSEV